MDAAIYSWESFRINMSQHTTRDAVSSPSDMDFRFWWVGDEILRKTVVRHQRTRHCAWTMNRFECGLGKQCKWKELLLIHRLNCAERSLSSLESTLSSWMQKTRSTLLTLMQDWVGIPAAFCWGGIIRGKELQSQSRWGSCCPYLFSANTSSQSSGIEGAPPHMHPAGETLTTLQDLFSPTLP